MVPTCASLARAPVAIQPRRDLLPVYGRRQRDPGTAGAGQTSPAPGSPATFPGQAQGCAISGTVTSV